MKHLLPLLFFVVISSFAYADEGFKPIVDTIESKVYNQNRRIMIYTPSSVNPGSKLSVIYTLNSDTLFVDMAQIVEWATNRPVPMAVVAVDYFARERALDKGFDPKTLTLNEEGEKFYRYLNQELIPHIDTTLICSGFNTVAAFQETATYLSLFLARNNPNFSAYMLIDPIVDKTANQQNNTPIKFPENFTNLDTTKIIRIVVEKEPNQAQNHYGYTLQRTFKDAGFENIKIDTVKKPELDPKKLNSSDKKQDDASNKVISDGLRAALNSIYDRFIKAHHIRTDKDGNVLKVQNCWEFFINANAHNEKIYKQPLPIDAYTVDCLLEYAKLHNRVEVVEKLLNYYRAILSTYNNPKAVTALADHLYYVGMVNESEKFYNRAIELFDNSGQGRQAIGARINFACDLLANKRLQLDRAWDILEQGKQAFPEDSLVYGYYQGTISAKHNYKLNLGKAYLIDALQNFDNMAGSFITAKDITTQIRLIDEHRKSLR